MPEETRTKVMDYAHKNAEALIRETALDILETYGLDKSAVHEIAGYPHEGFDASDEQKHFNLTTVVILNRDKTRLGDGSPCVGIQIDAEYRLEENHHVSSIGPNSSVITAPKIPTELGMMFHLKTGGKHPYRINL